jgi:hypothetical protein
MKEAGSSPPLEITPEIAAKCDGPEQFSKFDRLVRNVLGIPPKSRPAHSPKPQKKSSKKRA